MTHPAAEILGQAAQHNRTESHRRGNVLEFSDGEHLIISGDVHGHRQNLTKIIAYADLGAKPRNMLVLHEIIHGGPGDPAKGCRSCELLLRAARLKNQYPGQVHFLIGNHDIAQLTGNEITKDGQGVCKAFALGIRTAYGEDADEVYSAILEFLASFPLAGRCANGVFLSHSLPSPGRLCMFDPSIFDRPYEQRDFQRGQSIYELTWGRRQDETVLSEVSHLTGATLFINGHQPQANGFCVVANRQLILASDHAHGAIAEMDADQPITGEDLASLVRHIVTLCPTA